MSGICAARDAGVELEREVDDLRALAGGVADARADRDAVAGARAVEHAHGHDPRPVGEPGDAEAVAGRLRDRARDVRAVAVEVVGVGVVVDEVVALDEAVEQVGRALVPVAGRVGDAGVEHGDLDAEAAGAADRVEAVPRVGRVDPEVLAEVPLHALPAAERAAGLAGVVRDEAAHVGDQVRRGAQHAGPALELGDRLRDALAVADLEHPRARGEDVRLARCRSSAARRRGPAARRRRVADDHLVRDIDAPGVHVGRRPAARAPGASTSTPATRPASRANERAEGGRFQVQGTKRTSSTRRSCTTTPKIPTTMA